jgi:hypothetical protein
MAHPLHHAHSSARQFGGQASDYLALHQFFDQSKICIASNIHRLALHHTFGVTLCLEIYGPVWRRVSDGTSVSTESIARQHVLEDFGFLPDLRECLHNHPLSQGAPEFAVLPQERVLEQLTRKFGGIPLDYEALGAWFYRPGIELGDPRFMRLLGNSFGIFLAEQRFGISLTRASDGKDLPTRVLAEMLVYLALDAIPTLAQFFQGMPLEAWVLKGARRLSVEAR